MAHPSLPIRPFPHLYRAFLTGISILAIASEMSLAAASARENNPHIRLVPSGKRSASHARAVRDLPETETYPQYEIDNRKNDRKSDGIKAASGTILAAAAAAGRKPAIALGTGAAAYACASDAYEAHKDVQKMEDHNSKVDKQ